MADVEDAPHLRLGLRPIEEIRIFPRNDVPGRGVEPAFAHEFSPRRLPPACCRSAEARKLSLPRPPELFETSPSLVQTVERPLEPAGVGLLREIQIAAIGLAFAGERCLQIVFGFRTFKRCHPSLRFLGTGGRSLSRALPMPTTY